MRGTKKGYTKRRRRKREDLTPSLPEQAWGRKILRSRGGRGKGRLQARKMWKADGRRFVGGGTFWAKILRIRKTKKFPRTRKENGALEERKVKIDPGGP